MQINYIQPNHKQTLDGHEKTLNEMEKH